MDGNQVAQRRHRDPDRQRQAGDEDQGVGHQVADHRQQAEDEGEDHQGLGQRQVDIEQRQYTKQEDAGQGGVEQRDLDLGEDDVAKGLGHQAETHQQRAGQRPEALGIGGGLQGDDGTEDHADQHDDEGPCRIATEQLQLRHMGAHPFHQLLLHAVGVGRQVGVQRGRQLGAGALGEHHELVQQPSGVLHLLDDEAGEPDEEQRQQTHHQGAEQGHREPARAAAGQMTLQTPGQGVDQFVHQQPGQQAGQELERENQIERGEDDDPAGQDGLALREGVHRLPAAESLPAV